MWWSYPISHTIYPPVIYFSLISTCIDSLSLLSAPELISDCHSVYQQPHKRKIFCSSGSTKTLQWKQPIFTHIFCVVLFGLSADIYTSSRAVQAKQNVSAGVSIKSCVTTLMEATRTPPSFTLKWISTKYRCNSIKERAGY